MLKVYKGFKFWLLFVFGLVAIGISANYTDMFEVGAFVSVAYIIALEFYYEIKVKNKEEK